MLEKLPLNELQERAKVATYIAWSLGQDSRQRCQLRSEQCGRTPV